MMTKTFHAASVAALPDTLSQLSADGFTPTLAIVFASIENDLEQVRQAFQTRGMVVFGASSAGEILEDGHEESVYAGSIVGMVFDLEPSWFQVALFADGVETAAGFGDKVGAWAKAAFESPALLVMSGGLKMDGEALIQHILAQTGPIPLFGGLAGDDLKMERTFVFNHEKVVTPGVVALAFDATHVQVQGVASSGWQPVGGEKTITQAEGNMVYTIDGKPALDVYQEYLGVSGGDSFSTTGEYPLQIVRPDGNVVMRASMIINTKTKTMIYAGAVPQGSKVRFCVPPGLSIIDHALKEITQFKEKVPQADALVLFSCKGRHLALGPMAEDEVKPIQQLWGAPMVGFYTYGEIGQLSNGHMDFHNNTCVVVALKTVE